jgi:DNA-binding XRE family transcriptional regulator
MTGSALSEAAKRQKKRRQNDEKMKNAIEDYRAEKSLHGTASYQKTAEKFGVNRITLANLEQGKNQPLSTFNASKQKLTPAEEDVLVESIILASRQGIPHTHGHIREEANTILQSRLGNRSEKVGKRWVNNFLCRQNHRLHTYWSAPLPSVRAKAGNQENISGYFSLIRERIVDPQVLPKCMWSMDETQVNPDGAPTQRVVGESSLHRQHQQGLSNKQTITVLVTIGADGSLISPTTVFKGKKMVASWKQNNISKMAYVIRPKNLLALTGYL